MRGVRVNRFGFGPSAGYQLSECPRHRYNTAYESNQRHSVGSSDICGVFLNVSFLLYTLRTKKTSLITLVLQNVNCLIKIKKKIKPHGRRAVTFACFVKIINTEILRGLKKKSL